MGANPQLDSNPTRQHVSQTLITLRKKKGLTQTQLAQALGVTRNVVCDIEIGRMHMNEEILAKIAIFFKVSADMILGLEQSPELNSSFSLRLTRRFNKLQGLSPIKQRSVLHTLDLALKGVDPSDIEEQEVSNQSNPEALGKVSN